MFCNLPVRDVGVGLRHRHFKEVLEHKPSIPWFEVHSENFFKAGSNACHYLKKIREDYPLSTHCVGLSLASPTVDEIHLANVKDVIDRFEPKLVSDHLSWSGLPDHYLPDLLPVPYTEEALEIICTNIAHVQDYLQRQILIENPSSYLTFTSSTIPEVEFLNAIAQKTGCGILLDINNIYVTAENHKLDAKAYLEAVDPEHVKEMHLAGYSINTIEGNTLLIDTHGAPVYDEVWQLFKIAAERFPDTPTLIEWDTDVPEIAVLMEEAKKAETIIKEVQS